jgi:signal transduction histidine kinase
VLGSAFVAVYMLSAAYRQEEFTGRMRDRGINAAKLLIQVDEVNEALLKKIERDNPVRLPEESIRIYDHHSELIFHLGDEGFPPTEVQLLNTVRLHGIVERRHGEREEVALPFNDRYDRFVVVVSGNDIFGRSKLRNLAKVLLVTFLIGVLLTFFVGRWYAQRALTPVQRLVLEMRRIGPGDLGHRVPVGSSQDEIAELARSFNELIARLADAFQAQRNFIANASHELRTPLTTISGQLEVLLLRTRDPGAYEASLRSVLEDMHALNRLADRLLLLAQAETGSTSTTFVPVRVDEVLWSARHEVQRSDPRYRVDVRITDVEEEKDVLVNGNEALLRSLMSNLMENACKYSDDQCAHVTMSGAGAALRIEVANTGPGIDPALHARIFEPFYRATNTGGAKGHGIGLSLARRIAELHRGRITLRSAIGQGASFAVVLPKAA